MKRIIVAGNEIACGQKSLIRFACGGSISRLKDYTSPVVISLLLHVAQVVFVAMLSISILTITPLVGFMWIIFDPQTAAIPAVLTAGVAGIVILIITIVYMIVYHAYFFGKIGLFIILPIAAGFVTFGLAFIPIVGIIISMISSLIPWMTIAVLVHQNVYAEARVGTR